MGIAFAVAAVTTGVAIMYASFSDASTDPVTHKAPPAAATSRSASADTSVAPVASLVSGLEDRLRQAPNDGKGWLLLAKSYRHLGRLEDARAAYRKADALGHGDPIVAEQLFGLSSASANRAGDTG